MTGAVAQWLARCVADPVKAATVGSSPGRDRVKDRCSFFSEDSTEPVSPSCASTHKDRRAI